MNDFYDLWEKVRAVDKTYEYYLQTQKAAIQAYQNLSSQDKLKFEKEFVDGTYQFNAFYTFLSAELQFEELFGTPTGVEGVEERREDNNEIWK